MKKAEMVNDDLRREYQREDFGPMVRGKYAARLKESSNIGVLDSEIVGVYYGNTIQHAGFPRPKMSRNDVAKNQKCILS